MLPIEQVLRKHHPLDAQEARDLRRALSLALRSQRRTFPACEANTHLTASALISHPASGLVLLHQHKRLGLWLPPGGHIEDGEEPHVAAAREAWEETGARVAAEDPGLLYVNEHPAGRSHIHVDLCYSFRLQSRQTMGEGMPTRWCSAKECQALLPRRVHELLQQRLW